MPTDPCTKCPWIHEKELITDQLRDLAARGEFFCCHVDLHECRGAIQVGAVLRTKAEKAAA